MRSFVAGHEARSADEFIELAVGTPVELWLGTEDETAEERVARLDAARDILADDPGLFDRVTRLAAGLLDVAPLPRRSTSARRSPVMSGVAA